MTCVTFLFIKCFVSCCETVNFVFFFNHLSNVFFISYFAVSFEDSQYEIVPLTAEKVLEFIEQAYPNPITPEDLARYISQVIH